MGFMPDPDQGKASCFSAGDLLTPWGEVRCIYTKVMWGKGLRQMVNKLMRLGRPGQETTSMVKAAIVVSDGSIDLSTTALKPTGRSRATGARNRGPELNALVTILAPSSDQKAVSWTLSLLATPMGSCSPFQRRTTIQ